MARLALEVDLGPMFGDRGDGPDLRVRVPVRVRVEDISAKTQAISESLH